MATFNINQTLGNFNNNATTLNGQNPISQQQAANSNNYSQTASSDNNGLPYTNIAPNLDGQLVRNIITWFVPQFGTVRMFINPQNIAYNHSKLITKDRTKGGYTLQYWGEQLTTLNIQGTTGSSGVEGINALHEVYRSEQYAFDAIGLTLAGNNAAADVSNNLNQGIGGGLGQVIGNSNLQNSSSTSGLLGGILGLDSPNNMLSVRNIPSLASLAFSVEMYYNGWVFRGFFESMTMTERADNFLWDYTLTFTVTQKRGYRTNYFPWSNSPASGPSNYNTPPSFSGQVITDNVSQATNIAGSLLDALG